MKRQILTLFALAAVLCSCGQNRSAKQAENTDSTPAENTEVEPLDSLELKYRPTIENGTLAPEFELADTLGQTLTLSSLREHYVVLDFWASWCGDCRREIPAVKALYDEWKDKSLNGTDVQFVSVSFDHDEEAWKTLLRQEEFAWPQVSNLIRWKENPVAAAYGLHWIPSFVVVAPDGSVAGSAINAKRVAELLETL